MIKSVRGWLGAAMAAGMLASGLVSPATALAANTSATDGVAIKSSILNDSSGDASNDYLLRCYNLDGLVYDVFQTDPGTSKDTKAQKAKLADGKTTAQLVIQYNPATNSAVSSAIELAPGTYYVRENYNSAIAHNLNWNSKAEKVTVTSNNTADKPAEAYSVDDYNDIELKIVKKSADTGEVLGDAIYRVDYYDQKTMTLANAIANADKNDLTGPRRTWFFKTSGSGDAKIGESNLQASFGATRSDNLYKDASGKVHFPLGHYLVREVKGPKGYITTSGPQLGSCVSNAAAPNFTFSYTKTNVYENRNMPITALLQIEKYDAEAAADKQGKITQGDADLASTYAITNASGKPISFYKQYKRDTELEKQAGEGVEVWVGVGEPTIVPDGENLPLTYTTSKQSDGSWKTAEIRLPFGKYTIHEVKAGEGMQLDTSWSETADLSTSTDEKVIKVDKDQGNFIRRQGLHLLKVDADTVAPSWTLQGGNQTLQQLIDSIATGQGAAKLAGAKFEIKNVSESKVKVDGKWYNPGEVVATIVTKEVTTTDGNKVTVVASTASNTSLPYGTYEITETEAPEGYLPIVGPVGGAPLSLHPTQEENGTFVWYGWDPAEYSAQH